MDQHSPREIVRIVQGRPERVQRRVVEEYPLRLRVNGVDLVTLICSPHQLNFMVAGFFRLQGLVDSLDDFLTMGICQEDGLAEVRLRGQLPEHLQPVLTSGCGTGISFNLPQELLGPPCGVQHVYSIDALTSLMKQMMARSDRYRSHGGIHAAAVGDDEGLLLCAEDIGRHNTLDRLAGEALFRGVDLAGTMLVSSGRISAEMAVKAARLGIGLIATRTSPTDKSIELCKQAGIVLVGYLRGDNMDVFCSAQRLHL